MNHHAGAAGPHGPRYADRRAAGRRLAQDAQSLAGSDVVVFGIPAGGVPVAFEVAAALHAPLEVVVTRRLLLPVYPDVAFGAVGEGGVRLLDRELVSGIRLPGDEIVAIEQHELAMLRSTTRRLRHGRRRHDVHGRTALVVDDGMATGASATVACAVMHRLGAARVVVAVPVGSAAAVRTFDGADAVICPNVDDRLISIASHYRHFEPVGEQEVVDLLDVAAERVAVQ